MDYRRKITVEVEGLGKVNLRSLSVSVRMRIDDVMGSDIPKRHKDIRAQAEAIAHCWIDDDGKPVMGTADQVLDELDIDALNAIGSAIIKAYITPSNEDAIKNSESGQA